MAHRGPWTWRLGVLVLVAFLLVGCGGRLTLPAEALAGADAASVAVIWSVPLPAGAGDTLTVVAVNLADGSREYRAIARRGEADVYLGPLRALRPDVPLLTLFVRMGDRRIVVGRVEDRVPGTLAFIDLQRATDDPAHWSEAMRQSRVSERMFFMLLADKPGDGWDSLAYAAVQSRESLARVTEGMGAQRDEWATTFEPPLDLRPLYVHLP